MKFQIRDIKKTYRKVVLNEATLTISSGECVSLVGANGSGKSTLLSILAGVNNADSGQFLITDTKEIFGKDETVDLLKKTRLRNQIVSYVPQGTPLVEELTGMDNLRLWYNKSQIAKSCEDGFMGLLGVDAFLDVPVHKMSGGMKKRLSIVCALAGDPKLLLLDEPTAALDLPCREKIYGFFRDFTSFGGALLMVTHEPAEIEMSDTCYILKDGKTNAYPYKGDIKDLVERL
ncbi:MAG: ABC transporter ATP-binding protein [Lachnospiraceae bacterium]|nr:ABC transporter ATP-binding protein [Lachnospiraceae bacterium]